MELRTYWNIVWRRIWIVVVLMLVVLGVSLVFRERAAPPTYQASLRFIIGVPPEAARGSYYTYDKYYTWLASEYLTDDFSEVVKSASFAGDVSARLTQGGQPIQVPAGAIQGSTVTEKQHRILTMRIDWRNSEELAQIANAATQTLQQDGSKYFSQLGEDKAQIYVLDPPVVAQVPVSLRQRLDLPIRLLLGLIAALFLCFLVEYLDDTVRDPQDIENLGLSVVGTLPSLKRRLWPPARWQKIP